MGKLSQFYTNEITNGGLLECFGIVIVDRGWVFVGDIKDNGNECIITNAKNIRRWGSERGLGQLALSGPTEDTVLDNYGVVRIPNNAKIAIIISDKKLWTD